MARRISAIPTSSRQPDAPSSIRSSADPSGSPTILRAANSSLDRAAKALGRGDLVVFPTETVYGLGADAGSSRAVEAIFRLKSRPPSNPLIVHCSDIDHAEGIAHFDERSRALARRFWPGPLTLVLPARRDGPVCPRVRAGRDTLALRIPAHPLAHRLLKLSALPIAAPSANVSGRISPTRARDVALPFDPRLDCILDDGPCPRGIESTIVDLSVPEATILRPGPLTPDQIETCLPLRASRPPDAGEAPKAPGQSPRHYAPRLPMRLDARRFEADEAALLFDCPAPRHCVACAHLSRGGDLRQAAANLYTMIARLDRTRARRIAVSPIPRRGIGLAIHDRLRRACAGSEESP